MIDYYYTMVHIIYTYYIILWINQIGTIMIDDTYSIYCKSSMGFIVPASLKFGRFSATPFCELLEMAKPFSAAA